MNTLLQDLRHGVRMLRKSPVFTSVAVITLALGIGANTAIFSVVDAVLLRPLPYKDPDRLVVLWAKNEQKNLTQRPVSYANYVDWRQQSNAFDQLAAIRPESLNLMDGGEPERLSGLRVTTNILSLLGVQPA
jgi:putative ABC transport system permease protein